MSQPAKRPLVAIVGTAAAALICTIVPQFEGTRYVGYADPIGIPTDCTGNIHGAKVGQRRTVVECNEIDARNYAIAAEGVDKCTPVADLTEGQRVAAVSFAFNVGVGQYCSSTFARKLKIHDNTACAELSRWTHAGGRELPGLVIRRRNERAICEKASL